MREMFSMKVPFEKMEIFLYPYMYREYYIQTYFLKQQRE